MINGTTILMVILFTIVIAAFVAIIARRFTEDRSMSAIAVESIGIGAVLAVLNSVLVPRLPELSWLFLLMMIVFIGGLIHQWYKQGSDPLEFVCFSVLTLVAGWIARTAAINYAPVSIAPLLISILFPAFAIGFYAYTALRFHRELNRNDTEMVKKYNRRMAMVVAVVLMFMAGATGIVKGLSDSGIFEGGLERIPDPSLVDEASAADEADKDESNVATANWHYYNNDVQGGASEDDFNFGPEPDADTASEYDADFRERLQSDPALGAADIAWADAWLGTRYLGEFYESCNEDWAKTINAAKEAWIKDPDAYKQTLDAFFDMLNTADVKVTAGNGLEDQMYMNPYTVDGTPDVIVLVTPDHTGKFLTYYFTIKGTGKVKVSYRVECGYQPTNVEEIMGITPQDKPSSPGSPGKSNPPGKGDNPPTPTPTPPTPKYVKDKTKGVQGDKVKPGEKDPNTNNPSNPNKSKADSNDSTSAPGKTTGDNKANVEEKKESKERQTGNGGGSKPSTDSGGRTVDNSGGSDSGHTNTSTGGSTAGDKNDGVVSTPS